MGERMKRFLVASLIVGCFIGRVSALGADAPQSKTPSALKTQKIVSQEPKKTQGLTTVNKQINNTKQQKLAPVPVQTKSLPTLKPKAQIPVQKSAITAKPQTAVPIHKATNPVKLQAVPIQKTLSTTKLQTTQTIQKSANPVQLQTLTPMKKVSITTKSQTATTAKLQTAVPVQKNISVVKSPTAPSTQKTLTTPKTQTLSTIQKKPVSEVSLKKIQPSGSVSIQTNSLNKPKADNHSYATKQISTVNRPKAQSSSYASKNVSAVNKQKVQEQLPLKPISALTGQKLDVKQTTAVEQSVSPVEPQKVEFKACNKFFRLPSQKLFYLTLASINANRFTIDEIQSKSGYVLFSVGKKRFLASVINIDAKNSLLKITPCDNVYYFPIGIVQNMFKYVELNVQTPVEQLSVL